MYSILKWQKINFKTSQFNHFEFCRKSMTYDNHNVAKVFFFTHPTNPIWVWVQRIPSFFLYYCKQKYYTHFCMAWGFMLQNQGNMPWCSNKLKVISHSGLLQSWTTVSMIFTNNVQNPLDAVWTFLNSALLCSIDHLSARKRCSEVKWTLALNYPI